MQNLILILTNPELETINQLWIYFEVNSNQYKNTTGINDSFDTYFNKVMAIIILTEVKNKFQKVFPIPKHKTNTRIKLTYPQANCLYLFLKNYPINPNIAPYLYTIIADLISVLHLYLVNSN
jgi:hypothetical protein